MTQTQLPEPGDFRCKTRLRVRWAEVDMQKVVFNAHYLSYVDVAASEYWRALAVPYEEGAQRLGCEPFLKATALEYHASAQLDDVIDVGMRCAKLGNTSASFEAAVFCGGRLLVTAKLVYVFADASRKPTPLPQAYRDMVQRFEAGEPVVQLRTGHWNELGREAMRLRMEVFVREQGIPAEIEADEYDASALHAVATNGLGMCVATGRMLPAGESGVMRIGRMAVHRALRGQQWGRLVLDALEGEARRKGMRRLELHAQCTAESFYRRAGFTVLGERYEEAGIPHLSMFKNL